ncbi:hypothetical protein EON81_05255 [bacterium]|nr:MAG: hypothetical protein EON81_05255 [bacterium]
MTKPEGKESLRYFSVRLSDGGTLTEVELAHFDTLTNIYKPAIRRYEAEERFPGQSWHGPILIHEDAQATMLAYEHGSDSTIRFMEFAESDGALELRSAMGGYCDGDVAEMESPWFQLGRAADVDALLQDYRTFQLTELGTPTSRTPSIFYNTWNHQERLKYLQGKPYLSEMNLERMLAEVDAAHEMGIEVFVIDTGWYAKTGDWEVNLERFPDGLQEVRQRLEGYGMRLGLWFNPIVAAQTSKVFLDHPEWVMEDSEGQKNFCGPIWETEESWGMCVCSGWADHFAQTLVRLNRELGVSYFKWDAIHLYGCTAAHHDHGGPHNSIEERADRYAFESGRRLTHIVETVLESCPDAIVDFDFTERNRYFGLGFSSVGKMFLVNNGPYFGNFDIPPDHQRTPDTINVFFNPGSARPRVCRGGYKFDPFVPSILYLTHYLPDGPRLAQENSFASLVLGGNGIWGSLPELTSEDRAWWFENLEAYKKVRLGATRAYPRVIGEPGTSPEIHEKIDPDSGVGLVCFFTVTKGTFEHVTQALLAVEPTVTGADEWRVLPNGRLWLKVSLPEQGARVVFIGADR